VEFVPDGYPFPTYCIQELFSLYGSSVEFTIDKIYKRIRP